MSEQNFIWPAIWQELTNHAAVILLYFQKIKRLRLTFSFNYSTVSFSTMKTREISKNSKIFPGEHAPGPPLQVCIFTAQTHPPPHGKSWLRAWWQMCASFFIENWTEEKFWWTHGVMVHLASCWTKQTLRNIFNNAISVQLYSLPLYLYRVHT